MSLLQALQGIAQKRKQQQEQTQQEKKTPKRKADGHISHATTATATKRNKTQPSQPPVSQPPRVDVPSTSTQPRKHTPSDTMTMTDFFKPPQTKSPILPTTSQDRGNPTDRKCQNVSKNHTVSASQHSKERKPTAADVRLPFMSVSPTTLTTTTEVLDPYDAIPLQLHGDLLASLTQYVDHFVEASHRNPHHTTQSTIPQMVAVIGPPGCGKQHTIRKVCQQLHIPLHKIDWDSEDFALECEAQLAPVHALANQTRSLTTQASHMHILLLHGLDQNEPSRIHEMTRQLVKWGIPIQQSSGKGRKPKAPKCPKKKKGAATTQTHEQTTPLVTPHFIIMTAYSQHESILYQWIKQFNCPVLTCDYPHLDLQAKLLWARMQQQPSKGFRSQEQCKAFCATYGPCLAQTLHQAELGALVLPADLSPTQNSDRIPPHAALAGMDSRPLDLFSGLKQLLQPPEKMRSRATTARLASSHIPPPLIPYPYEEYERVWRRTQSQNPFLLQRIYYAMGNQVSYTPGIQSSSETTLAIRYKQLPREVVLNGVEQLADLHELFTVAPVEFINQAEEDPSGGLTSQWIQTHLCLGLKTILSGITQRHDPGNMNMRAMYPHLPTFQYEIGVSAAEREVLDYVAVMQRVEEKTLCSRPDHSIPLDHQLFPSVGHYLRRQDDGTLLSCNRFMDYDEWGSGNHAELTKQGWGTKLSERNRLCTALLHIYPTLT